MTQELRERMHASMERRVFEQTQANDEDLRSQLASVIKEERERKVGLPARKHGLAHALSSPGRIHGCQAMAAAVPVGAHH